MDVTIDGIGFMLAYAPLPTALGSTFFLGPLFVLALTSGGVWYKSMQLKEKDHVFDGRDH